ncbi:MAG: hypothetical protein FWD55_05550 [Propionibacteriaceae bacterium]|nr:hypothetical protein [Propionibacteriaceae bacterium]
MDSDPHLSTIALKVSEVSGRADLAQYRQFRYRLYAGDSSYSATEEFILDAVLGQTTRFARSCWVRPLMVVDADQVVAQCILIHDPAMPAMQVGFFEALPDYPVAVEMLLDQARREAVAQGLDEIIVGLNGHLSYGVGILSEGFAPASFNSSWNKPYYQDYFATMDRLDLSCYASDVQSTVELIRVSPHPDPAGRQVSVRVADKRRWGQEMEILRTLCDATLGTTSLYAPTNEGHFEQLFGPLRYFLRPENLLFAVSEGREVGFCFWHPDFNEVLPFGRRLSIAEIAVRLALPHSFRTSILNAVGVLPDYRGVATAALMARWADAQQGRFERWETTFIWDDNQSPIKVMQRSGAQPTRRFSVWREKVIP